MEVLALFAGFFASFSIYYSAKAFSFSKEAWSGLLWVVVLFFSLGVGIFLAALHPLFGGIGFLVGTFLAVFLGRGPRADYTVALNDKIKKEEG